MGKTAEAPLIGFQLTEFHEEKAKEAWAQRAIFRGGRKQGPNVLDYVPDRRSVWSSLTKDGKLTKEFAELLQNDCVNWFNQVANEVWDWSERTIYQVLMKSPDLDGDVVICRASCRGSYGYMYLSASRMALADIEGRTFPSATEGETT